MYMYVCAWMDECRGVQYVYWVMHECIMVKVGGKRNTHKVLKSRWIFLKQGGIFKSRGIMIFAKQVEIYWNRENRGEIRNLWSMTKKKKGHREIFREKVKFWKFSIESENFSKIGGKIWNRGKCIMPWPQAGWTPRGWMHRPMHLYVFMSVWMT